MTKWKWVHTASGDTVEVPDHEAERMISAGARYAERPPIIGELERNAIRHPGEPQMLWLQTAGYAVNGNKSLPHELQHALQFEVIAKPARGKIGGWRLTYRVNGENTSWSAAQLIAAAYPLTWK